MKIRKMVRTKPEKLFRGLKENVPMREYTTFKIGGNARYFLTVKDEKEVTRVVSICKRNKIPFFVFGFGSNLLVSDRGFDGLAIKFQSSKFEVKKSHKKIKFLFDAGVQFSRLVSESIKQGASGIEWAAGIPGTMGGAIYGNAGSGERAIGRAIVKVKVLNSKSVKKSVFSRKNCNFGYRDSVFKKKKNFLILTAEIELERGNKKEVEEKIREILKYKKARQPLNFPSAGSIFKNTKYFSAGELIEKCGLKGKRIGNVEISKRHANFIVNLGAGKAKDVIKLINLVKKSVKNKFEIKLEEEIQYLGF